MRKCAHCKIEKLLEDFVKHKNKKGGISSYCKPCNLLRQKAFYENKKQKLGDQWIATDTSLSRHYKQTRKQWFAELKKTLACIVCNFSHPEALDFHHTGNNGDKYMEVANMVNRGCSEEMIINEIEKCEVLCANCHRIHHYNQRKNKKI